MDKVRSRSALPQLSLLKARMMSHEGHAAEAVDWLLTSEIVAYQTRGRSLLGALHHCIADTAALGELRNEMLVHSHEPKFWDAVDRFNANLPPAMDLKGTLGSAVETARAALRDYKQMDVKSPSFADRYREYMLRLPSVKRTVEATLVMRYRELAEALPQAGQGWGAALKETARIDAEIQADNSTTGHYVGLMMPRFQGALRDAGEVRQQRNEILALCDVYEDRLLTGKFPSRLPSPIPRDAFSGKPLTYHIENGVPIVGPTR